MQTACEQVRARPADLVQALPSPSLPKTQELMRQADLVVATGGAGMLRCRVQFQDSAYGVGVGNAVRVVERKPRIWTTRRWPSTTARRSSYATSCGGQHALVVHASVYDELVQRLTEAGAHLCDQPRALRADGQTAARDFPRSTWKVATKSAERIAELAGFKVGQGGHPGGETGTRPRHPFSGEKLSVVLAVYRYDGDISHAASWSTPLPPTRVWATRRESRSSDCPTSSSSR